MDVKEREINTYKKKLYYVQSCTFVVRTLRFEFRFFLSLKPDNRRWPFLGNRAKLIHVYYLYVYDTLGEEVG